MKRPGHPRPNFTNMRRGGILLVATKGVNNMTEDVQKPQEDAQADGYYGDDDMGNDDLDLSFLDQDDEDEESKK